MNEHEAVRLGMFINELERLQKRLGIYLDDAKVFTVDQTEPVAKISAGGGQYVVALMDENGLYGPYQLLGIETTE